MSILQKIVNTKIEEVANLKKKQSLQQIKQEAQEYTNKNKTRNFIASIKNKLNNKLPAIIAEIKQASPSKGIICHNFLPAQIAQEYEKNGASCLSILTDKLYFKGDIKYLQQARGATKLPVIRKDFIIDEYQIYQSALIGADAILLIASILSAEQMQYFEEIANSLNLAVLPEIHHQSELEKAIKLYTPLIGINNRNLETFTLDLTQTIDLLPKIKDMYKDKIIVTESGILNIEDVKLMRNNNVNTFLVGEAFMKEANPINCGKKLFELFLN